DHSFCKEKQTITCRFRNIKEGSYHISVMAKDYAGNISKPGIEKTIIVDLSPDFEGPVISNITPTETTTVYTHTPRITFHLTDVKSGVDKKNIAVKLNGHRLDVIHDETTGWGYAFPNEKLTSGLHTFTIAAEDRAGNKMEPIKRRFQISMIEQPSDSKNFRLTIIPDTHSIEYGRLALKYAATDESDFTLHMGDMVDQGTEQEFGAFIKNRNELLHNKRMLAIPGNHESFLGHLNSYMHHFGSPAFHFEYGNLLL